MSEAVDQIVGAYATAVEFIDHHRVIASAVLALVTLECLFQWAFWMRRKNRKEKP